MSELKIDSTLPMTSGHNIPILGYGTCNNANCTISALAALNNHYTHLDTAQIYKNETETGQAIAQSKIDPSKLFIVSKLWDDMFSRQGAIDGLESSLKKLGLKSIDLYLMHNPTKGHEARTQTWLGLQDAVKRGLVKSIGVSNWSPKHIDQLMAEKDVYIKPACNQIEFHPWNQQKVLMEYCQKNDIVVVAYSPLAQGKRVNDPAVTQLAEKYKRTPAQIILRWCVQKGVVVIPKSDKEHRIIENAGIFGWELKPEDVKTLDAMDLGQKGNVGDWDPFAWD